MLFVFVSRVGREVETVNKRCDPFSNITADFVSPGGAQKVPNQDFVVQEGRLRYFAAIRATILVETTLGQHKACHILFTTDGSIYVQFPYFRGSHKGILSNVDVHPETHGPTTFDLKKNGKVASSLVKFSHHPDGRVHFSQDRKILTKIKRMSWPLDGPIGQIFQLNFYHLRGLELLSQSDFKPNKLFLPFRFVEGLPFAVTISGEWRRKKATVENIEPAGGAAGPAAIIQSRKTGQEQVVFFLGQPESLPLRDHILMLSCTAIPLLEGVVRPTVILLGGWDHHEVVVTGQQTANTGFLICVYPVKNFDALATMIGSLDYSPKLVF